MAICSSRSLICFLLAILFLSGCASPSQKRMAVFSANQEKQAKVGFKETKVVWQQQLAVIEKHYPKKAHCSVYGFITPIGDVLKLGGTLKLSGLKKGDRITSVNSIRLPGTNFFRFINQFGPKDNLNLKVLREGSTNDIEVQCVDGSKMLDTVKSAYKSAISKKWDTCKANIQKASRITGLQRGDLLWTYGRCAELQVSLQGEPLNRSHASNYFQSLKANIDLLEYDAEKEIDLDVDVRNFVSWAPNVGSADLGNRITQLYQQGLQKRDQRIAKISNPIPKPTEIAKAKPTNSQGTCFAVSPDGEIVTNQHVVDGMSSLQVRFEDGNSYKAKVVKSSKATDLAVLKIDRASENYLPLADSGSTNIGDEVFTLGYPVAGILGLDIKYTAGVISSESGFGNEASYMQITVPLQPGNSGGPLINQQGEVVGVTTASARVEAFFELSGTIPQNINFAVKSNYVSTLVGQSYNSGPVDTREAAINRAKSAVCMVVGQG